MTKEVWTIPEIRDELVALALRIERGSYSESYLCMTLLTLAEQLKRRPTKKRAQVKSEPMTPALAAAIRRTAIAKPQLSQAEIAVMFNVNPGRVSEAIYGKRGK